MNDTLTPRTDERMFNCPGEDNYFVVPVILARELERELASETKWAHEYHERVKVLEANESAMNDQICMMAQENAKLREERENWRVSLLDLLGQVEQAREGFGIYCDSPSMEAAITNARKLVFH